MDQNEIIAILNRRVFTSEKAKIHQTIVDNPDRYIGVFRSMTPRLKLLQNLLQSREIRFGAALEDIITELILRWGLLALQSAFIAKVKMISLATSTSVLRIAIAII